MRMSVFLKAHVNLVLLNIHCLSVILNTHVNSTQFISVEPQDMTTVRIHMSVLLNSFQKGFHLVQNALSNKSNQAVGMGLCNEVPNSNNHGAMCSK